MLDAERKDARALEEQTSRLLGVIEKMQGGWHVPAGYRLVSRTMMVERADDDVD